MLRIKQLILEEGLTLSGARRRLEEDSGDNNGASVLVQEVVGDRVRQQLRQVKSGLKSILELLAKDDEHEERSMQATVQDRYGGPASRRDPDHAPAS